ncbi:MAG: LPS export ABC transporter permease LptF, partial [Acidobacteria bacterium]|nr:LPS export ABC transporter permease LptF [Acidobacteriota bacterium]
MRIIDRYIAREVFSHALLGLAIFTFVLFVPRLVSLMELVARHSAGFSTILLLFVSTLPAVLTFTIPMAVLLGVLIGLGRMSSDSEVIALHALGIGLRRVLLPVGVLAGATAIITGVMTFLLGPASLRTFRSIEDRLRATQASFQIQPRVFDERFPRLVLYVHDVEAAATRWRGVFLAESDADRGSRLTLAEGAIVIADREQGKLQLHLQNGSTHEYSRSEPNRYSVSTFGESDLPVSLSADSPERTRPITPAERSAYELVTTQGPGAREASVEFHRRLAMPAACLVFALIAVPIGARPRRGGRAGGFIVALLLICGYYLAFIYGAGMAKQGRISPFLGMWAANFLTALFGLFLLPRMEQIRGRGLFSQAMAAVMPARFLHHAPTASSSPHRAASVVEFRAPEDALEQRSFARRMRHAGILPFGFPLLMDLYVLRKFTYFFVVILFGFLLLFDSFTFFELLDDIARHNVPSS